MGTIQIKRGLKANLPSEAVIGALLYTIDEKKFYIGNGESKALTEFTNSQQLVEYLATKSDVGHTHTSANITDFSSSVDNRIALQRGQNNGLASLDENGKVPTTQIPSIFKDAYVVDNIAERDKLEKFSGLHALVIDATDDETVESGGAEYVYGGTQWIKISELKDLDMIIDWENIQGRPFVPQKFVELGDCPGEYTGQKGKVLVVNEEETGLEFSSIYTGDVDGGTF
nr:MAG TPA: major tropism determinant [Caudoviricetes sp.]